MLFAFCLKGTLPTNMTHGRDFWRSSSSSMDPLCHVRLIIPRMEYGIRWSNPPLRVLVVSKDSPDQILWVNEIHFAPPKKPWSDDSSVNTNKRYGFNHGFQVVQDIVHPQYQRLWFQTWFPSGAKSTSQPSTVCLCCTGARLGWCVDGTPRGRQDVGFLGDSNWIWAVTQSET